MANLTVKEVITRLWSKVKDNFVNKNTTIAGVDLGDNITDTELGRAIVNVLVDDSVATPVLSQWATQLINNNSAVVSNTNARHTHDNIDILNGIASIPYTKDEVNSLIEAITTIDIQVVDELPTEGISTSTIYLVPKPSTKDDDIYNEYIYVNEKWEHIGSTQIDLSNYVTKEEVQKTISKFVYDEANEELQIYNGEDLLDANTMIDEIFGNGGEA